MKTKSQKYKTYEWFIIKAEIGEFLDKHLPLSVCKYIQMRILQRRGLF